MLEHAEIRFDPTGTLTLLMGTHDHGQGHGTTFKQVLFDKLGIDSDLVKFKYGDTDQVMTGTGTFGSRSAACGGSAVVLAADKVIAHGKKIAAHLLEAAEADLAFEKGKFTVTGTDKSIGLIDVAKTSFMPGRLPRGMEYGLFETGTYNGGPPTYPNGCHVCEVEVDRRDRLGRDPALHRGRRGRPRDQSAAARRPGAWRHRASGRPMPDGRHQLRPRIRAS